MKASPGKKNYVLVCLHSELTELFWHCFPQSEGFPKQIEIADKMDQQA